MNKFIKRSSYPDSYTKFCFDLLLSFLSIIILLPLILAISIVVKFSSAGPIFFIQKRTGKDGKTFRLIKFRTMNLGAEKERNKIRILNEADGPVFKIIDDPRYTKIGKFLAHTGLDELPQLFNVLRCEMSIVGPRPLPTYEANKLTKNQKFRQLVKPGITSSWVISGSHKLKFKEWMQLDKDYVTNAKLTVDLKIITKTAYIMLRQILKQVIYLLDFYNFT